MVYRKCYISLWFIGSGSLWFMVFHGGIYIYTIKLFISIHIVEIMLCCLSGFRVAIQMVPSVILGNFKRYLLLPPRTSTCHEIHRNSGCLDGL